MRRTMWIVMSLLISSVHAIRSALLTSRRQLAAGLLAMSPVVVWPVVADDGSPVVLTDEEMAARVRRKQELLARKAGPQRATDLPLDYNPEAGVNLRAKSINDNLKESLQKQAELNSRDKKQKRDDLCEMLGRGC